MQYFEYTTLVFKPLGAGNGWYVGDERLGDGKEADTILNRYASRGWRLVSTAAGGWILLLLERPHQPGEVVPAERPEGRGNEVSPTP